MEILKVKPKKNRVEQFSFMEVIKSENILFCINVMIKALRLRIRPWSLNCKNEKGK